MHHVSPKFRNLALEANNLVRVDPNELLEYWRRQSAGQMRTPSGADGPSGPSIPLGLYGDDARFNKAGDKIIMISMNVVLHKPGKGEMKRYPIWTLREFISLGRRSVYPVMRLLAWSFNVPGLNSMSFPLRGKTKETNLEILNSQTHQVLFYGVHPSHNVDGESLPPLQAKLAGKQIAGPHAHHGMASAACVCTYTIDVYIFFTGITLVFWA